MEHRSTPPRILLKLSGEALSGGEGAALSSEALCKWASSLQKLVAEGHQLAVVVGGGNLFRGVRGAAMGMARTSADQIGMMATLMNGVALQQALQSLGAKAHLLTALECPAVAEPFRVGRAVELLEEGAICLCVGGVGHPYFTTDTAAALRASEIGAHALCKATKVDGIYSADPKLVPGATLYRTLSYEQLLAEKLEVMDATAVALCRQSKVPIFVFHMEEVARPGFFADLERGVIGSRVS